jgi:hypothetical protein
MSRVRHRSSEANTSGGAGRYEGILELYIGTGGGGPYNYDTWYYVGASLNDNAESMSDNRSGVTLIDKSWPPGDDNACAQPYEQWYPNLATWGWGDGSTIGDSISSFDLAQYSTCQ